MTKLLFHWQDKLRRAIFNNSRIFNLLVHTIIVKICNEIIVS